MDIPALNNSTQLQEALAQAGPKTVVVDFTATWCGPCKKIAPVLQDLAAKNSDDFNVFKADVDVAVDLVSHFKVSSMPTFIFFRGNKVVYVLKGASTELLTQAFEIIQALTSK
jgi:thioredoxin 1